MRAFNSLVTTERLRAIINDNETGEEVCSLSYFHAYIQATILGCTQLLSYIMKTKHLTTLVEKSSHWLESGEYAMTEIRHGMHYV